VLKFLTKVGTSVAVLALVAGAGVAGFVLRGCALPPQQEAAETHISQHAESQEEIAFWTCSMHPQIRQPGPGKCPICHMDLVPVYRRAGGGAGSRTLVTTPEAAALMDVQTAPVERRFVTTEVRMVGKVAYDETRLGNITAWVPGRLDRLFVDYTGVEVHKGDHMVYLYSPQLIVTQEELLQSLKSASTAAASKFEDEAASTVRIVEATRGKLRRMGLTDEQIKELEKRGASLDHETIYAPLGGTVIEKNAVEGMYVDVGTRIYTIADLSHVWVKLDAYESDLVWLRYGQKVTFTTEAYPGRPFTGWIAFMDPVVDATTRTVKVRVNVPNPERSLKPGMFVHGIVRTNVAAGGRVMDPDLAGKWVCPMHPDVVKAQAGTCDVCGMDLVTSESLGYLPAGTKGEDQPLVIPVTAALVTGKRAVVYVRDPKAAEPTFEGREVELGPRAGEYYVVLGGLAEGELVVTNGNFKIDSALQIQAKPSMMAPEGGGSGAAHQHGNAAPPAPEGPAGGHGHE